MIKDSLFIRPKLELPQSLIYRTQYKVACNKLCQIARIVSLKDGKIKGEVVFYPSYASRVSEDEPSVFVSWLNVFEWDKGYGTKLLNYIKAYSRQVGCKGNFWLNSSANIVPQRAPHTFYRKYGMSSDSKKIDNKLDKFIKKNKIPTYKDMYEILMYYPPIESKKNNLIDKLLKKYF